MSQNMSQNNNETSTNPYKKKRRFLTKIFFSAIAFSIVGMFVVEMLELIFNIGKDSTFIQGLAALVSFPAGIALFLAIPYIAYMIYLTSRARIYDRGGESEIKEIKYEGHVKNNIGPWVYVIIMLIIMPPIGMFLVIRKALYTDPTHYLENSIVLKSAGISAGIIGMGLFIIQARIFTDINQIPFMSYYISLVPVVCGVFMYAVGRVIRKKGVDIALCQKLIGVDGVLELNDLARNLNLNYIQTARKIQKYIIKGFLPACFIDYRLQTVVSPREFPKEAVKCRRCGGTTVKIKGLTAVCSFCGRNI